MLMGPSICATLGGTIGLWRYRGVSPTTIPSCRRSVCPWFSLYYTTLYTTILAAAAPLRRPVTTSMYVYNNNMRMYIGECGWAYYTRFPIKSSRRLLSPQRRRNGQFRSGLIYSPFSDYNLGWAMMRLLLDALLVCGPIYWNDLERDKKKKDFTRRYRLVTYIFCN